MASLLDKLAHQVKQTEELNYGRAIVSRWAQDYLLANSTSRRRQKILDLGLGQATDIRNIIRTLPSRVANRLDIYGVDFDPDNIQRAQGMGIEVFQLDLEYDRLPLDQHSVDIVIANQVLEHMKNIFFLVSEVARVLRPNGIFIIGVPNLASLHNRIMLLLGLQPSTIQVVGPHVRSFTKPGMTELVELGGFFQVQAFQGSNFYPFPPSIAQILARVLPTFAVGSFYLLRRTKQSGSMLEQFKQLQFETKFYLGETSAS